MTFKQDIIDLFSGRRGGHVQKWLYADHSRPNIASGSNLWHDFVTANKNYYPIREEIEMIPALIAALRDDFDSVVDFGIGDEKAIKKKTTPILRALKAPRHYTAIDVSNDNLDAGIAQLRRSFPALKTHGIEGDFYDGQTGIAGQNLLGLFLGTTISNIDMRVGDAFPREDIVEKLKALRKTLSGGQRSSLVLSLDANPDLDHALAAYQHIAWTRMMTGLMYDVQSQLRPVGNFQPSMWHYRGIIDHKNHVLQQTISPSADQDFSIDGQEFHPRRGDTFVVMNNFKYPHALMQDLLTEAGLRPAQTLHGQSAPMVMIEAEVM